MEALICDCRIAYRYDQLEGSDAPVILFLHGWGCDGSIYSMFQNEFCKHVSVLSVDFPGHGQSGEPSVPWGVPEYAEQILGLLSKLSISKVNIVAHSFGGRVALWIAAHQPQLVDKMVITGGAGIRKPAAQTQTKKQLQYKKLKALLQHFESVSFLKGIVANLQEKLVQKYGSEDYKRLNANMRQTFVKVINQDLSDLLPKVKASTLLIWGSNDTETPLWMGQKMEKEIPDAGLVVFDGRSHFAFLEESQRFRVIVETFFWGGNAA
ncbi:MAG: alpha/beta hydrolase [Clostridia bacterium]|nr:alpha/beta hydrolase [Clostridia bacterium]